MNSTSEPIGGGSIGGFAYGLGISIAAFIIFTIITYASYKCKRQSPPPAAANRRRSATYADSTTDDDDHSIHICTQRINGLDQATLASYPELTYAQIQQKTGGGDGGGGCAICLADYKDSDLLRLLPDCGHVFHTKCVDLWLVSNASCPICRYSPLKGGVRTPPPVAAVV